MHLTLKLSGAAVSLAAIAFHALPRATVLGFANVVRIATLHEETFIFFIVPNHEFSVKDNIQNLKKLVYWKTQAGIHSTTHVAQAPLFKICLFTKPCHFLNIKIEIFKKTVGFFMILRCKQIQKHNRPSGFCYYEKIEKCRSKF